jgi:hypothetical protein
VRFVLIAGAALLGATAGAVWGAAHPDPFFGRGFNAFIDGTLGFGLGVVAGAMLLAGLVLRERR